jgi:serine phosphatase RsbU (regulator of sigma subunit)
MYTARTERKILGYALMLRKLEALRDELSIIPIYELDRILKTVAQMLKIDRALWLDVQNDKIIVRYEYDLTQVHEINKDLHNLSPNYISSKLLSACKKHKKVLAFNLDRKSRRKLFNKKQIKKSGPITEYMIYKNISALLCAPITKDNKILSFIYFENKFSPISFFHKTLVKSISSQLTTIKITSDNFKSLQELNKKLEDLVEKRTRLLQQQTAELNEKEKELKEKIEELELYNEQLNAIHNDLERHKQEIEQKNFELEKIHTSILEQKQISEERNKKLTENLLFAKTIQQIILQIDSNLPFADLFIFYKPKQIVSGDFYWIKNFKNKTVIAVADCTGHGVPGAFMSLLSASILKDTITKNFITLNNPEIPPGQLLDQIRDKIIKILGQEFYTSVFDSFNIKDGMDIALAIYDKTSNNISYAGAYIPMWIIRDEQLFEFKADRQPIGIYYKPQQIKPFRTQKFQLKKGDIIYMFSDGFADQFNPNGEKFYKKNLKKLLLEIHHYPGSIQRDLLEKTFLQWKGDYFQVDDVLVVGIII